MKVSVTLTPPALWLGWFRVTLTFLRHPVYSATWPSLWFEVTS